MAAQWWVVLNSQSAISQILDRFINPSGPITQSATEAVVVESAAKPGNYYKGPYATKALAQAQADAYNNPNLGNEFQEAFNRGASSGSGAAGSSILGLPELHNLRNFVVRMSKVVVGLLLIAIGTVKLFHVEQAVKTVAPTIAKAAVL